MEQKQFELTKVIWTQDDFEIMGWHDSKIWGFLSNPDDFEYLIDLDYIFKWEHPKEGETYFKFWVSPVTMAFENAWDIKFDLHSQQGVIEIANFHMENPRKTKNGKFTEYSFRFECHEGEISLNATGFKMFVRKFPQLQQGQSYEYAERGGVNFDRDIKDL